MNPRIVSDGEFRLLEARKNEARGVVASRYAAEWARAGFFRRLILRWRIHREISREVEKNRPSPGCLYNSQSTRLLSAQTKALER